MRLFKILLKLFMPSWNFFDRFDSYFELEFFYLDRWRQVTFFSDRKIQALLFSPIGNYELYLRAQLDILVEEIVQLKNPEDLSTIRALSSYRLLQSFLRAAVSASANQERQTLEFEKETGMIGDSPGALGRTVDRFDDEKTTSKCYPMRIFDCRSPHHKALVIEISGAG